MLNIFVLLKPSSFVVYLWAFLYFPREKEEQLTRVTEVQRLQAQQADAALEEFKRQVELNSEKVYAEMKEQVRSSHAVLCESPSLSRKICSHLQWDQKYFTFFKKKKAFKISLTVSQGFRTRRDITIDLMAEWSL